MATDYKLDSTGDLDISTLAMRLHADEEHLTQQRLQIRLRTYTNEWFLNTEAGIPYLDAPFTDKNNKVAVDNVIATRILETEGVVRLADYSSEIIDRQLYVSFRVESESGDIISILNLEIF